MPLPIAHSAIGFTTYSLCGTNESGSSRLKALLGILVLSSLPDVDVVLGIILHGNGNVFHRGPTHSLVFALIGGFLTSRALKLWPQSPEFSFRICFLLILSHVVADSVFTSSPVSFFWPITVNWTGGYIGLKHVVDLVLFGNHRDAEIIVGCGIVILLHRTFGDLGHLDITKS
jgi:membrane-bound metal-dependent hydrolase YbcI (DUF457 family)